jgi:uncharacterized protein (TIGR00299 family) protein
MNHLHIDCFSGISGDMFLGALIDAGLPLAVLKRDLQKIQVKGYQIKATKVHRGTIHATKVDIRIQKGFTKPLSFPVIRRLISTSRLPSVVKTRSLEAFNTLAEAEGTVHGVPFSKVHFHEVGVVDSFIDIVGAFLGCAYLDIETVSASAVNVGSGTIQSAHGTLPVPGPAVAHLAKGVPIFATGPATELTTPTGMCILTVLTSDFLPLPPMRPNQIGYGAGTDDPKGWPNVLRVFLSPASSTRLGRTESIIEVQTNVDDLNPQVYEALIERLVQVGALDVTLTPVIMKRTRPGTIVTALAPPSAVEDVTRILFQDTTTLGVRIRELQRRVLFRDTQSVGVPGGQVRVKVADLGNGTTKMMPEFQDCKQVAEKTGRPVREILEQARQAFLNQVPNKATKRKPKKP